MFKRRLRLVVLIGIVLGLAFGAQSCKKDKPEEAQEVKVQVLLQLPKEVDKAQVGELWVYMENTSSKHVDSAASDKGAAVNFVLPVGSYDVRVSGRYVDASRVVYIAGTLLGQNLSGEQCELNIELTQSTTEALVIKEFYYGGCVATATNKAYQRDQYLEIYNNSAETVYADGISICITAANTNKAKEKQALSDYIGGDRIPINMLYQIPGSGREVPIAPGKSIVIAERALNHKAEVAGSPVDLSGADFEIYDNHKLDIDVPSVPNLKKYYSYSQSFTVFHAGGAWSLFLVRTDKPVQEVLDGNIIEYKLNNGKPGKTYAIPARYVIDAVQTAKDEQLLCQVFPSSLDAGFTYSTTEAGKCVQRKVAREENGRFVLEDTNNSTNDFKPNATPSPRVVAQ